MGELLVMLAMYAGIGVVTLFLLAVVIWVLAFAFRAGWGKAEQALERERAEKQE